MIKWFLTFFIFQSSLNLANAQDVSILFIGNSLTYSNDLPAYVQKIGGLHDLKIETTCLCFPNYGLEDHWNEGKLLRMIVDNSYDFIIFQQGPSSQAYGRSSLHEYGGNIAKLAIEHGATPVYFMVWPSLRYYHTMDGVIQNHQDAAKANNSLIAPVGKIWKKLRMANSGINLYSQDQFHPSRKGTLLAALIVAKSVLPNYSDDKIRQAFKSEFSPAEFGIIFPK